MAAGFAVVGSKLGVVLLFLLYGVFYAIDEGQTKAYLADLAPEETRATAIGTYGFVTGLVYVSASPLAGRRVLERVVHGSRSAPRQRSRSWRWRISWPSSRRSNNSVKRVGAKTGYRPQLAVPLHFVFIEDAAVRLVHRVVPRRG